MIRRSYPFPSSNTKVSKDREGVDLHDIGTPTWTQAPFHWHLVEEVFISPASRAFGPRLPCSTEAFWSSHRVPTRDPREKRVFSAPTAPEFLGWRPGHRGSWGFWLLRLTSIESQQNVFLRGSFGFRGPPGVHPAIGSCTLNVVRGCQRPKSKARAGESKRKT